jgi:hypothetical protein
LLSYKPINDIDYLDAKPLPCGCGCATTPGQCVPAATLEEPGDYSAFWGNGKVMIGRITQDGQKISMQHTPLLDDPLPKNYKHKLTKKQFSKIFYHNKV